MEARAIPPGAFRVTLVNANVVSALGNVPHKHNA
jgi:hypothetical protein